MSKWLDDYVRKIIKIQKIKEEWNNFIKAKDIDVDRNTFMGLYNSHKNYMIQYKN